MSDMRLHVMSDLHFEHYSDYGREFVESLSTKPDDVLVLAGDIWSCAPVYQSRTEARCKELCEKAHVVYVPGNHEYYGTSLEAEVFLQELSNRYGLNVLYRWNPTVTIKGQRFVGDTMWFPRPADADYRERRFSDFKQIGELNKWCYDRNTAFREYLQANLKEDDVVVTHHMPSPRSIATQYIGDAYNCFFLSDMSDIIASKNPKLWIHGHTHEQFDYVQGRTRIIANARGYPFEPTQKSFDPELYVDL